MGDQHVTLREGILIQAQKFELSSSEYHRHQKIDSPVPLLIIDHILEKKISPIAFRPIFPCGVHFQLDNHDLVEKARWNLSPLIQNNVQQDYLLELYLMYLCSYQNCPLLWYCFVARTRCWLSLLHFSLYRKPWGWGKILPNSQKLTPFPHHKIFLNRLDLLLPLSKLPFLPHPFLTSGIIYTHAMFISINRCLLNVVISMKKVPLSKISILSTFQFYLENPAPLNASFPLFQTTSFSNFIKFQLTPLQLGYRGLWANQI